ncbi:trypsin-like serine peptidase [Tahibacter amnicola]|uniref:Serine protease n=1 Tax=Tahibacter amnicola TaxID=2976241 RepID=A0ABY6B955_9GAMM|nr:serine protease [Tahibacter amnicola]UXI66204.1 serine protease [Tahibacter amnicola]
MNRLSAGVALTTLLVCGASAAGMRQVVSEPVRSDASAVRQEQWRAQTPLKSVSPTLRLPPLAAERISSMQRRNSESRRHRLQVGLSRSIASEATEDLPRPARHAVDGGVVLDLDVVSPEAEALRVGIHVAAWPDGVELRVAGSRFNADIFATPASQARAQASPEGLFWTAVTDGDRQHLELFIPDGVDPDTVVLRIESVSHLVVPPQQGQGWHKALGDSDDCNIDVVCRINTLGDVFAAVKDAVAHMVFQSNGGSFVCTGTLLNDADSATQIPYFFTAHHCIGNQTEASSLTTFWRYETPDCGTLQSGARIQVTGGAQLLYSQSNTDGALLRLNSQPPAGAVLAGWDAAPLSPSTPVTTIHHPRGDNKKVSRGNHSGTTANVNIDGQLLDSSNRASWSEGTTQGGSSGAGLFTGTNYQLRGGLAGGSSSCANSGDPEAEGNVDFYSRLDQIFPSVQQYLMPVSVPGPTRDYTGQWDLRTESGRGLSMFAFNQVLFVLWFVYDNQGRATWYSLDVVWSAPDRASGRVLSWTGSPWGPTYNPDARVMTQVGTFSLTFTSATQATFTYNVLGVNRTIEIAKFVIN